MSPPTGISFTRGDENTKPKKGGTNTNSKPATLRESCTTQTKRKTRILNFLRRLVIAIL